MFGKWFSRKETGQTDDQGNVPGYGMPVREPQTNQHNDKGRPPEGADRDFVYHER
jgi:hypothetical protein